MSDICSFKRGSKAILYANFTSLAGKAFNPPFPKISIYFKSTEVLAPTTMSFSTEEGLFYFEWDVPSTLSVGAYAAVYSGNVDGVDIQSQGEFFVA